MFWNQKITNNNNFTIKNLKWNLKMTQRKVLKIIKYK